MEANRIARRLHETVERHVNEADVRAQPPDEQVAALPARRRSRLLPHSPLAALVALRSAPEKVLDCVLGCVWNSEYESGIARLAPNATGTASSPVSYSSGRCMREAVLSNAGLESGAAGEA